MIIGQFVVGIDVFTILQQLLQVLIDRVRWLVNHHSGGAGVGQKEQKIVELSNDSVVNIAKVCVPLATK